MARFMCVLLIAPAVAVGSEVVIPASSLASRSPNVAPRYAAFGDLTLCVHSPCVDAPDCGQVGALGIGCSGPNAVIPTTWGGIKRMWR